MLKTEEPKKEILLEEKPCIFGAEIKNPCPVRMELKRADPMEKYIKPSGDYGEIMEAAKELMDKLLYKEWTLLHSFCVACPFLVLYENRMEERK